MKYRFLLLTQLSKPIITMPARIGILFVSVAIISQGCTSGNETSTHVNIPPKTNTITLITQSPPVSATPTPEATRSGATQSATPSSNNNSGLNRQLLLTSVGDDGLIWVMNPPYKTATALLQEEGYNYSSPMWSKDGRWIAFVRSTMKRPVVSSIWMITNDGDNLKQIGPEVNETQAQSEEYEVLRVIKLLGWSDDRSQIAAAFYGDLSGTYIIPTAGGPAQQFLPKNSLDLIRTNATYAGTHLKWYSSSPSGDQIFFSLPIDTSENASPIWLTSSFTKPDTVSEIQRPQNFVDDGTIDYPLGHTWSPDGEFLLLSDHSREEDRLWAISLDTGNGKMVVTEPAVSPLPNIGRLSFVSWSPDGTWVAWWSITPYVNKDLYDIVFLRASTWQPVRKISSLQIASDRRGELGDWVKVGEEEFRMVVFDPRLGEGIYLLDPQDSFKDTPLVSFSLLAQQIRTAEFLDVGPWQP